MFHVYTSNRIEHLADTLARLVSQAPLPPLVKEIIIIPSSGMEKFVALNLAQKHRICANISFPFPNAFIHSIFRTVFPELPEISLYEPDTLSWRILAVLPSVINQKEFHHVKQYISNDPTQLKTFQVAGKIADILDQYTIFRPDMIDLWEKGELATGHADESWQSLLWREIVGKTADTHRAKLKKRLLSELQTNNNISRILPQRISLFGISYLPGFHLDIMHALSYVTDVHLFILNPCALFWDDIISEKISAKKSLRQNEDLSRLHYETGNNLLASFGTLGKEFMQRIHALDYSENDSFFDPEAGSLLGHVHYDILHLASPETKTTVAEDDRSIQVHVCHSPLREIEVLHDTLLSFFEKDPSLAPDDIVVMSPDMYSYVPYIQTVFDDTLSGRPPVPYCIADSVSSLDQFVNDFFLILDCSKSRFTASSVLSVIESRAVRDTFGLSDDSVEKIRNWVADTNIRWGIDSLDRKKAGVPATAENTWRAGLDRLFSGYALYTEGKSLFDQVAPYQSIDETDTPLLGTFSRLLENLWQSAGRLEQEHTLPEWVAVLTNIVDTFLDSDNNELYLAPIRRSITSLLEYHLKCAFTDKISFTCIRYYLRQSLCQKRFGAGFLRGGVTFCTMLPMRAIPFKIVCLIGMDDTRFPRKGNSVSFDLIAAYPRIGDRSFRNEDRYCFLEAILSARDQLYISYVGHTIKDNSVIPPSVVVCELIDYIAKYYSFGDTPIEEALITEQKLSSCNRAYFSDDSRLFSYSHDNCAAAQAFYTGKHLTIPEFITTPLPLSDTEEKQAYAITIEQLCSFLTHPVSHFLKNRLRVSPAPLVPVIEDREPFSIDALDSFFMQQDLVENVLGNDELTDAYALFKAQGILPHGTAGAIAFNEVLESARHLASKLRDLKISLHEKDSVDIAVTVDKFSIQGRIRTIAQRYLLFYKPSALKPKDLLRHWIYHLLLSLHAFGADKPKSILIGKSQKGKFEQRTFAQPDNPITILREYLCLYESGLTRPLPFYAESSYAFSKALQDGKSEKQALEAAHSKWSNEYSRSESDDPYYSYFPGVKDPFAADFSVIAQKIFTPLFNHIQPEGA